MELRRAVRSIAVATLLGSATPAIAQIAIERVDVDAAGNEGNQGGARPAVTPDGHYVVFDSWSDNLVAGDTNAKSDVFLKDLTDGAVERVSVSSAGAEGNDGSWDPRISADGNLVAFSSNASNFFAGDGNMRTDVFVHDRTTGTTECVSVDSTGVEGNAGSVEPAMTPNGRFVAFSSSASNLILGDHNGFPDIFLHDRTTGKTTRVSVQDGSFAGGNGESSDPCLSDDGHYVAFTSRADDLVGGDTNGTSDVFVRDRQSGTTERVSVDSSGAEAHGWSSAGRISADGRYVAFQSDADDLVAGDTNGDFDVFVHDRTTGVTERVSVDSKGRQVGADSAGPSLSADGRFVAFSSASDDLVEDDSNGESDAFVHDRLLGTTERVSLDATGGQGNGDSGAGRISAGGQWVTFDSFSTNLVSGDTNHTVDTFVVERCQVDAEWSNYGAGLPGTFGVPALTSSSDPVFGTSVTVDLANSCGQWTFALLFEGVERASIHSSLGGDLLLIPLFTTVIGLPPSGASYSADLPTNGVYCGMTIDVQAIESDPGAIHGASFTQGLELLLGH